MLQPIINPKIKDYLRFKGKINTNTFMDLIKIRPHDGQVDILNAYAAKLPPSEDTKLRAEQYGVELDFEYKYDTILAACGRRFGKSFFSSVLGSEELMIPNSHVLLASYTLDNCDIIFMQIREILVKLGIELTVDRKKDRELETAHGSRLTVASNENVESRLGNAVSLLILDEAKKFHKKLYEQTLLPMLADYAPYGRSILISSPEDGWLKTYYDYGQSRDPKYKKYWSVNLPTMCNPTIPKSWIDNARNTLPPDVFEQEIEGKFTSSAGLVCAEFSKERNVRLLTDYPYFFEWVNAGEDVVNSIDPGYSHCFASVHFMYVSEIDTYLVFGCYSKNKLVTPVHAENIKEFEFSFLGRQSDMRYCDPAAAQCIADFSEYDLHYNKSEKPMRETIVFLNQLLWQTSEKTGEARLIFLEDCEGVPELIRQVSTVRWKEGMDFQTKESSKKTETKPFEPDRDRRTDWDALDSLRYSLFSYNKSMGCGITTFDLTRDDDSDLSADEESMYSVGWVKM